MPVAVDPTPAMAASKPRKAALLQPQDIPLPDTPKSTKKPRKKQPTQTQDAPVPGPSKPIQAPSWTWRSLTATSSSRVPLLFTKDGNYFFSASGPSVKIYSVTTSRIISALHPPPVSSDAISEVDGAITCMALNPHNSFQLITGSLDGLVRIWDFVDGVLLGAYGVSKPIHHLAVHEKFRDEVYVSVARPAKRVNSRGNPIANGDNNSVLRVLLKATEQSSGSTVRTPVETRTVGKTRGTSGLAFSPSGSWLVAAAGHKAYVASTSDLKAGFTKFVSPDRLTCLAFHPSEEYFATGDEKGVVRLWYCLNDSITKESSGTEKKAPTTTLHWHAHAVSCVAFTANGAYLLTGGEEAVLVVWQLHTGKKEFIPRLGGPITDVAVSNPKNGEEEYLVGLADASFVFVRSGTLKISRTVARIKIDPAISNNRPIQPASIPLAVHSLTSTLVLPSSHPSMIQMYAPTTADLISELEVSPSNKISRRDEKQLEPPRVERSVVSESGRWMATVDARSGDNGYKGEVYLKMWAWDRKSSYWTLNTRIDRPHGLHSVTSVAFRPATGENGEKLVTTGSDGAIKLWRLRQTRKDGKMAEVFWVAQATINFRAEVPTEASWSTDGSLLAVALGPYIGLYDAATNMLSGTLSCPECPTVLSAQFVGRSGRYIAAIGSQDLVLWDVITQRVQWHYRSSTAITRLASRSDSDTFAVFEQGSLSASNSSPTTKVAAFTPASSTPITTQQFPFALLGVIASPPGWPQFGHAASLGLIAVTHTWNVVALGENIRLQDEGSAAANIRNAPVVAKPTLFQNIFGVSSLSPPISPHPSSRFVQSSAWKGKDVEKIFDAPAYLVPPLDSLFDPLISSFLVERPPEGPSGATDGEDVQHADDAMDADMADEPILVGNRLERTVGSDEMAAMVDLFKSHAIHSSKPIPNGIHVNGTSHLNGVASHSPSPAPSAKSRNTPVPTKPIPSSLSKSAPSSTPLPAPSTASPSVRVGQKRKKSLGS